MDMFHSQMLGSKIQGVDFPFFSIKEKIKVAKKHQKWLPVNLSTWTYIKISTHKKHKHNTKISTLTILKKYSNHQQTHTIHVWYI